jgi:hypothetical protein
MGFQIETKIIFNIANVNINFHDSKLGVENLQHFVTIAKNYLNDAYIGCLRNNESFILTFMNHNKT